MIHPRQTWCIQIDVTNACHLHCSNCTRLLDHASKRFVMSPDCFEAAVKSVKDFPTTSEPCPQGRRKVVGIIGGEPLLHPEFPTLVDIMIQYIPEARHRGLWTSKDWKNGSHPRWGPYAPQVYRLLGPHPTGDVRNIPHQCGYLNWNMHLPEMRVHHQPILVAVSEMVPDEKRRWELIADCWVQRDWSPSITTKGAFFCEVAAAFDMIFGGPGGLPIQEGWWKGDIRFVPDRQGVLRPAGPFRDQINTWCPRCGACLPMQSRLDSENKDDVSPMNLVELEKLGSPRVKRGEIVVHQPDGTYHEEAYRPDWKPMKYIRGERGPSQ